jgi:signal transduction histidine kinase/ActR/RegA family two-component response regulator
MTVGAIPTSGAPRGRSLRFVFGALAGASIVAIAALSLLLTVTFLPRAAELRQHTQPVSNLFGALRDRMALVERTVRDARGMVVSETRGSPAAIRRTRAALAAASSRVIARPYSGVPAAMREALSRADEDLTRLENRVQEVIALSELGSFAQARARMRAVDSLAAAANNDFSQAQRAGFEDLLARQAALDATAREATWIAGILAVVAILLPALSLLVLHRRIARPLADLRTALDRVSTGDLTIQLPVPRGDELGLLAEHFNAMTAVLRDRAEGQGRFAATGELLAGIAHEVNNPLQAIRMLAEYRLGEPGLSAGQRADLEQIHQQTRRAGKLLSGLLHFVRPGEPEVTDQAIGDLVAQVVDLLSYQFGVDEIHVENRVGASLPHVRADAARLEQIFVNLLSNAIDAVRGVATPRRIALEGWEHDGRVYVSVVDNGPGLDREVAGRVFQPFVTTKGARGTGLGLYVSRQLARETGGDLQLRSTPGEGARFVVWFPAIPLRRPAAPAAEAARAPEASALAGLSILVVDDEESIRRPLSRYLARLGATVMDAGDGLEALAQLRLVAVDAIVLDLRMPRMDGVEFYAALRRERPALSDRVLFLSGDPQQLNGARAGTLPAGRVLAKPVDLQVLASSIRRLVGRRSPT